MNKPDTKHDMLNLDIETAEQEGQRLPFDDDPTDVPSWFARTYQSAKPDELADRYRTRLDARPEDPTQVFAAQERYRRHVEERFQAAKSLAEQQQHATEPPLRGHAQPPARRPIAPVAEDEGLQRFHDWEQKVHPSKARARKRPTARIAAFVACACLGGSAIGYFTANPAAVAALYQSSGEHMQAVFASLAVSPKLTTDGGKQSAEIEPETVLTKKPVKIAKLAVADASGALNNPIPLDLAAFPADPAAPIALRITGLPDKAYLTQGTEVSKGLWLVKPGEIKGIEIVVPSATSPQFDLAVAPIEEKTGIPAAPSQSVTVELSGADVDGINVVPASAPPEIQGQVELPQAIPLPLEAENSESMGLMGKGDTLLKTGDLVSARQFYLKAHGLGLAQAAFGVAQTYDPLLYQDMKVRGLQPDKAKAEEWYGKAVDAGYAPAGEALAKLSEQAAQ